MKACNTDASGLCQFTLSPGDYGIVADSKTDGSTPLTRLRVEKASKIELTLEPAFFDEPQFTVAGVVDNTYRGGHGADTVLSSSEDLASAAKTLGDLPVEPSRQQSLQTARDLQRIAEQSATEANLFNWGTELLNGRAPQAALAVFSKGTRRFPQSTRMLLALAACYYASGDYSQAARAFFDASDLNPDDPRPYQFMSLVKTKDITDLPAYREHLARFVTRSPQNALANYYYAVTLWNQGRSRESVPLLKTAVQLNPHLAQAYLQLGVIAVSEQNYRDAIPYYERTITEDPSWEEAHFRLADAYRVTGNLAKAQYELAEYRRLSSQNAARREHERSQIQQLVIKLKSQ